MDIIFKNRKVLIFGLGLNQGGVGSAQFFARNGAKVRVTDLKNSEILKPSLEQLTKIKDFSYTLGEHKYEDIDWADLIIKNPAVKPGNPYIEYASKIGKSVETDMGIFLQFVKPQQIIGVTGTKGKSTTASLIYDVLRKSLGVNVTHTRGGIRTHRWEKIILAGNIGRSVLDTIPYVNKNALVILEISSFQLESFETHQVSPKWAVITNITPDHLNYYETMEDYIEAKKVIGKYQDKSTFLFLRKNDPLTTRSDFLSGLKSKIIYFSRNDLPATFHPKLLGNHNLENMAAALSVAKIFGLDEKYTLDVLSKFKGIPFRMELVKDWHGVKIYNDTSATNPESGIHAIETFPGCILICGGMNKKMDYTKYATIIRKNVKKVFFLEGDATGSILTSLRAQRSNLPTYGPYNDLETLLQDVKKVAKPGDTILFSPAATSFNLFQNEFDRGRKFSIAVERIFG